MLEVKTLKGKSKNRKSFEALSGLLGSQAFFLADL